MPTQNLSTTDAGRPTDLATLAEQINEHHLQAEEKSETAKQAAVAALEHARICGKLLSQAKAKIGHGGLLAWLDDALGLSGGSETQAPRPRASELALPFGFRWQIEEDHIRLTTPTEKTAKLYMTGAKFPTDSTRDEHEQFLHVLNLFGDSLYMQLATREAAA